MTLSWLCLLRLGSSGEEDDQGQGLHGAHASAQVVPGAHQVEEVWPRAGAWFVSRWPNLTCVSILRTPPRSPRFVVRVYTWFFTVRYFPVLCFGARYGTHAAVHLCAPVACEHAPTSRNSLFLPASMGGLVPRTRSWGPSAEGGSVGLCGILCFSEAAHILVFSLHVIRRSL